MPNHQSSLKQSKTQIAPLEKEYREFKTNTSLKIPEELDDLEYLYTSEPIPYAADIVNIHQMYGVKVIGGCCESDERHIEEIAKLLIA